MIIGAEAEVEPKDVVKGEDDKPCAKAYLPLQTASWPLPLRLRMRKWSRSRHCHIAVASNVKCDK